MARESVKARQRKREAMVAKFAEKRAALKAAGDYAVRLKNRCQLTGRPKGYMRHFGICRVIFREMALDGKIPGVRKASW
jgi:small subunit ribosomal protein S14